MSVAQHYLIALSHCGGDSASKEDTLKTPRKRREEDNGVAKFSAGQSFSETIEEVTLYSASCATKRYRDVIA